MAVQAGHIVILLLLWYSYVFWQHLFREKDKQMCSSSVSLCRCLPTLLRTHGKRLITGPERLGKVSLSDTSSPGCLFLWDDSWRCRLLHHTVSSRPLDSARRIHKVKNHIEAPTVPDPVVASRVSSSINCDGGDESRSVHPPPIKRESSDWTYSTPSQMMITLGCKRTLEPKRWSFMPCE